ncbi:hypothetical protein ACFY2R_24790 [Micromonospora olivasterospora]|uniref:Ricin-type beta-trefoil lectin protein n=1 Tax=Micromonospora olivasterospora TaxID=1880 RepID=A0A562I8L1_MICOL|nr:hypothetical protein [Micromonospora olivasterospora]TWH67156.1 hypothetical protein JD77_02125 [Micromonospora olivasterospora]
MQGSTDQFIRGGRMAALCAGLLLTQQACAADPDENPPAASTGPTSSVPAGDPQATPSATTGSPTTGGGGNGDGAILRGERQVVIAPVGSSESILAVDDKGRLNLTEGSAEYSLFVLDPAGGGRHQIKTAKAGSGGESFCMGLRDNGTSPTTVVAAGCDTSTAGQLFTLERMRATDKQGRPTYEIRGEGGVHLRTIASSGLVAQPAGDEGPDTTFAFVDNGKATLPELD